MCTSARKLRKFSLLALSSTLNLALLAGLVGIFLLPSPDAPETIDDLLLRYDTPLGSPDNGPLQPETPVEYRDAALTEPALQPAVPQCQRDEFTWLVCAIYFEARDQSESGQYILAQSILNRVEDSRWPDSIEGVVRQGEGRKHACQYSFMCDGKPERINDKTAWQAANQIAVEALEDFYQDVRVTCAHSYRATYVTSQSALKWFATLQVDDQVDSHIFYCDKPA